MGTNASKPSNAAPAVRLQKSDLDNGANSDPRSPTPEIARTPLQGKTGAKHSITKNADLRKTFESSCEGEEKLIHNNPILTAVIKNHLQSYDPRSPTQDFDRTPIIIASKIEEVSNDKMLLRQQDNNFGSPCLKNEEDENYDSCAEANESPELIIPKNLCNGFFDLTLNDTFKDAEEPLGSSTASNDAIENNLSHESASRPTQVLETNFDYIETNLNEVKDNEDDKSIDERNLTINGDLINISLFKLLDNDPRSPSAGIERTPIVVSKTSDDASEDNVEEMSDDTLIKVLQSTNADLRQAADKNTNEGVLIYEDESSNFLVTPKKSKSDCNSGSRTPLSCMKNKSDVGHARSKSANTVDDTKDYKNKIARRVSHIPRLKSLSKQPKTLTGSTVSLKGLTKKSVVSGDCENTPPNSHRDKWDKDHSIVL